MRCWSIGIVVSIAVSVFGHMFVEVFNNEIFTKLYGQTILRYGWLFFWGCFLAEYKSHILPILTKYWFIPLLLGLIPYLTKIDIYAGYSVFGCVLMVSGLIGFAYSFPQLSLRKDISYGVFLYHMIIVNIFITVKWTENWFYGVLVVLISSAIAYISTVTIGAWSGKRRSLQQ